MNSYRLFVLDDAGQVVDSMPFRTDHDDEACAWALHVAGERRYELWHDKRRVHCSHEGPSVLEQFFSDYAIYRPATQVFSAGAVRT